MRMRDFNGAGKASVIFGGQFGSEGKGLAAAWMAERSPADIFVTNASANAGHTTVFADGSKKVAFHLPSGALVVPDSLIVLDAGAVIDPAGFMEEIDRLDIDPKRILIHPRAAIITAADRRREENARSPTTHIASTRKGVGAALTRKIARSSRLAGETRILKPFIGRVDLNAMLSQGRSVQIELPQGFSLGINSGLAYPECTSREITVMQALADAGIHPTFLGHVMMVLRTYPIRVGHITDGNGQIIGHSGPSCTDQREIAFGDIGVAAEYTTVTKRKRRIFTFSRAQVQTAAALNRPDVVFLNFVNYLKSAPELDRIEGDIKAAFRTAGLPVPKLVYGLGPALTDVAIRRPAKPEAYNGPRF
ncbi:MAG: adenylosuccinate synthetase [Pseudomonadota bacterium]|nr:adenylosuccinate synthetase [Pseudomonadota bacterium]